MYTIFQMCAASPKIPNKFIWGDILVGLVVSKQPHCHTCSYHTALHRMHLLINFNIHFIRLNRNVNWWEWNQQISTHWRTWWYLTNIRHASRRCFKSFSKNMFTKLLYFKQFPMSLAIWNADLSLTLSPSWKWNRIAYIAMHKYLQPKCTYHVRHHSEEIRNKW